MGPSRPTPSATPQRRLKGLESRWQTLFSGLTKRHLNWSESTCTECLYCQWYRCYSAFEHKEDTQDMADLPTGTVTFLFTDVEGSTKLWERYPEAMQAAIARHDEILSEVMDSSGGYVFKAVGDAFCVAFSSASHALEAAHAAQRALLSEDWEEPGPLRVRMALHTGTADERGGDYFGPPVNRVARLLSAGHGGQVLLSTATQELVRDALPEGTKLRDLGERRLKDLFRPEGVFQAVTPGLPSSFPPL